MPAFVDLKGLKFDRLLAIERLPRLKRRGNVVWKCFCDCGNYVNVSSGHLRSSHTKSCGCLSSETAKLKWTKHGFKRSPKHGGCTTTYKSWLHMRDRCNNNLNQDYSYYGGRGITYTESWDNFQEFLNDMGECPKGHSIERIDVNGNYEPSNCKWIPKNLQSRNRRGVYLVEYKGEMRTIRELETMFGLPPRSLKYQIRGKGLDLQTALETIAKKRGQHHLCWK